MRRFVIVKSVVNWADSVVMEGCNIKVNARVSNKLFPNSNNQEPSSNQKENPGAILQVGFSPGSRSQPVFQFARTLKSAIHATRNLVAYTYSCISAFDLLWNMCTNRLPAWIIKDFNNFLNTTNICRLSNEPTHNATKKGDYSISIGDEVMEFQSDQLASPVGFFGMDYAKYFPSPTMIFIY